MKIEQLTLSAGPGGIVQPGCIREVSSEEAAALIASGAARPVREVAAVEPIREAAVKPEPIRRRVRQRGQPDDNN